MSGVLFLCRTVPAFGDPSWDPHLALPSQGCWNWRDGLEKEQEVGMAGNSWADQQERNEEAGGQEQEMTEESAPWEEENRRWGWLHLAPKKIKAWVFFCCCCVLCG